jgi:DNA-binding NtrC family response regulator
MGRLIAQLGHLPTPAKSAEEADMWLATNRYDLLLLDIEMPGMNGLEFLPWALKRDKEMPVIMLTGVKDADVALRCLEAGARNYLVKPPELSFLKLAVTDALAVRQLLLQRNRLARGEAARL